MTERQRNQQLRNLSLAIESIEEQFTVGKNSHICFQVNRIVYHPYEQPIKTMYKFLEDENPDMVVSGENLKHCKNANSNENIVSFGFLGDGDNEYRLLEVNSNTGEAVLFWTIPYTVYIRKEKIINLGF